MGATAWLSAGKFAIIAVVAYALISIVGDYLEDNRNQRNALIQANADKVSEQSKNQILTLANTQLEVIHEIQKESIERSKKATVEIKGRFTQYEDKAEKELSVLRGDKLARVAAANPNAIEKLSNEATKKIFMEFETIFDGS